MTDTTFGVPNPLSGGEAPTRKEPRSSSGDDPPATERDVIDWVAFRDGDEECFRAVLDRHGPLIRSVVSSYADSEDDREDLYQETCIRILEQRHRYRDQGSMGGWVRTVARHVARNWRESRSARESAKDGYVAATAPIEAAGHITEDPSRLLNYNDLLAHVERALDSIPTQQANALRLVQKGYSAREAAKILEVKTATVRSNVRHARKKLRKQFDGLE
ncbi:MAG: RNA polymerase sigma factor [Gemmatimonadota bacterium]|nr:RNA polymerase sigma factor [Gemmatimonadota bacterium]